MIGELVDGAQEVPISLYLSLEQGVHADLLTVSRAGISFTNIITEIAQELFPDAEIRVEAIDAAESSYIWNTVTKVYLDAKSGILRGARRYPKVAALTAYVALRVLNNAVDWSQDQIMDWLSGADAPAQVKCLTTEEKRALADDIVKRLSEGLAERPSDRLFKDVSNDTSVKAVGVTANRSSRPQQLVPRAKFFVDRALNAEQDDHRVRTQRVSAVLISPVLISGERRWKFRTSAGEFGATLKDQIFLDKVLAGELGITLRAGLVLEMDLETTESIEEGVWHVTHRTVRRVYGWHDQPRQTDLLSGLSSDIQEDQQPGEYDNRR